MTNLDARLSNYINTLGTRAYIRNPDRQSDHNKVLLQYANHFDSLDKYVQADHITWKHGKPTSVGMHVPDISVFDRNGRLNIEIETIDSCSEEHSISQIKAFSRIHKLILVIAIPPVTAHNEKFINRRINNFNLQFSKINRSNIEIVEYQL